MEWAIYAIIVVVSVAISLAMAPKPPQPKASELSDLSFPTAEPGRSVPVVFGDVIVTSPNVVWYGDLATTPIYAEGGK